MTGSLSRGLARRGGSMTNKSALIPDVPPLLLPFSLPFSLS